MCLGFRVLAALVHLAAVNISEAVSPAVPL